MCEEPARKKARHGADAEISAQLSVVREGRLRNEESVLNQRFLAHGPCWNAVLERLSLKDRSRSELVSKSEIIYLRLRSQLPVFWRCQKSLSNIESVSSDETKRAKALLDICGRIGSSLRSLTLSISLPLKWKKDLPTIAQKCPSIDAICLTMDTADSLNELVVPPDVRFDSFTNLRTLRFLSTDIDCEPICASVATVLSTPPSLEILRGFNAEDSFASLLDFQTFFRERPSLKEVEMMDVEIESDDLDLEDVDDEEPEIFPTIAEHCRELKKLRIEARDFSLNGIELLCEMRRFEAYLGWEIIAEEKLYVFCLRCPALESFGCSQLSPRGFDAIASLTRLRTLKVGSCDGTAISVEEGHRMVAKLLENSGASLRHLELPDEFPLSTAVIEMMAQKCSRLRMVKFWISSHEAANPESIRFLVDSLVASPNWRPGRDRLRIELSIDAVSDEAIEPFEALSSPVPPVLPLPPGVEIEVN